MSGVKSVPADYSRSRLTARTRWRAGRQGRRDAGAGIGTGHYARKLQRGLSAALGELRSVFIAEHAALIDRVHAEAARIVTEYDQRAEHVPAALARFGGWVSQWRTEVTACQQRGRALAACADHELAHYEAAYAREVGRRRRGRPPESPSGERPSEAALDEVWTGEPDWMLEGAPVLRALKILEQRIGPAAGRAERGTP
ncbi:hypothetical protein ACF1AO_12470 [Streptomyces longwoodensis]|uniref:hypothetical protein n=1 Tax=Streptomyces longwoodensis TaxID=68231 RepID=UPI0036F99036